MASDGHKKKFITSRLTSRKAKKFTTITMDYYYGIGRPKNGESEELRC